MAQGPQTLPSISTLTNELPQDSRFAQDPRLSQASDFRDSGNYTQSKHSSTVSNPPGLQLQTILNNEDSRSPARVSGSIPDTPNSARFPGPQEPGKWDNGQGHLESPPSGRLSFTNGVRGTDDYGSGYRGSLETPSALDSRRSSVDSRMHQGLGQLAISPQSPYASENASRVSLVSDLQQQRGILGGRNGTMASTSPLSTRLSGPRAGSTLGPQPRRAPVITPLPRNVSGAPNPTAEAPTKGFAWAFPDNAMGESRRSTSEDSSIEGRSIPSRQNSFAGGASIASSVITANSEYPPGQRRFEDVDTHHHSIAPGQHRAVTNVLQSDGQVGSGPSGNYSRTPELRVSHKMAERKRRSEMKTLFDELNSHLPNSPGGKSSKWEVLTRAIDHIKHLKHADLALRRDAERLNHDAGAFYKIEAENQALRAELTNAWNQLQRTEPNTHHIFGNYTNMLATDAQQQRQHPQQNGMGQLPPMGTAVPPSALPTQGLPPPFPPTNGAHPAPMEGVQQHQPHYQ